MGSGETTEIKLRLKSVVSQPSEKWKYIYGHSKEYAISSLGRVVSFKRKNPKLNGLHVGNNGYLVVALCKNGRMTTHSVHRLLGQAFIPNPKNLPHINHINSIRLDNSLKNLEWTTNLDNHRHARSMGRYPVGQNHPLARLSTKEILIIRSSKLNTSELSNKYSISVSTAWRIKNLQTRKYE